MAPPLRVTALGVLGLVLAAMLTTSAGAVHVSADLYGLTKDNRLVRFSAATPGDIDGSAEVDGLRHGETLIGIDFRPRDGKLWGVARLGTTGRMVTIDPSTGEATHVTTLVVPGTPTPVALDGTVFGVDFNPAADALRIVSDSGQNLRAIPSATSPSGAPRVTGDTFADGALNRGGATAVGVSGAAYTNNDNDPATGTTLYDIDAANEIVTVQNPPNTGTLVDVGTLGVATDAAVGFDIRTVGAVNVAYASLTERRGNGATLATLYTVDLGSGTASPTGRIGGPKALRDIAAAP